MRTLIVGASRGIGLAWVRFLLGLEPHNKIFAGCRVPPAKLFTPEQPVGYMWNVLSQLSPDHSGGLFAWDRERVPW